MPEKVLDQMLENHLLSRAYRPITFKKAPRSLDKSHSEARNDKKKKQLNDQFVERGGERENDRPVQDRQRSVRISTRLRKLPDIPLYHISSTNKIQYLILIQSAKKYGYRYTESTTAAVARKQKTRDKRETVKSNLSLELE